MTPKRILVTGATGYIGGRLVPCLLEGGHEVRCFVRDASLYWWMLYVPHRFIFPGMLRELRRRTEIGANQIN